MKKILGDKVLTKKEIFKFTKDYKYIFSYSGINKLKIFLNIIKLLFYKLVGKRFVIKEIYGNKMILDLDEPGISKILFLYGKREMLDTDIIRQEVGGNMNVLDVGANIGYYTILEASLLDKGKVYAFEPDPRNIEVLRKNVELNRMAQKISFYPYAVAEKNCTRKFNLSRETNLSSFTREDKKVDSIEVKCIKLDDFAKEKKMDFIRMDIEGYECMVVAGMIDFLREKEDVKLQIEVHPAVFNIGEFSFLKELKMLGEFGFRVKYLISAGTAKPAQIVDKGYKPIKSVREGKWSHGLYENIKMEDLLFFLDNETKIVRSILLEKKDEKKHRSH